MEIYGYARVSSHEQKLDRQLKALSDAGVVEDHIFSDKASGKDFNRPSYQRLMKVIKEGDILVIKSLDRLSRHYEEALQMWSELIQKRHIQIKVIDTPFLNTNNELGEMGIFINNLIVNVLFFSAEQERKFIKQRQAEGIAIAKEKGVAFGRPTKKLPENFPMIYNLWKEGYPITALLQFADGYCYSTLRNMLKDPKKYGADLDKLL